MGLCFMYLYRVLIFLTGNMHKNAGTFPCLYQMLICFEVVNIILLHEIDIILINQVPFFLDISRILSFLYSFWKYLKNT